MQPLGKFRLHLAPIPVHEKRQCQDRHTQQQERRRGDEHRLASDEQHTRTPLRVALSIGCTTTLDRPNVRIPYSSEFWRRPSSCMRRRTKKSPRTAKEAQKLRASVPRCVVIGCVVRLKAGLYSTSPAGGLPPIVSSASNAYSISRSRSSSSSVGCGGAGGGGGSSAGMRTCRYHSKPVPAGINRPIVTFSFSPRR